MFDWVDENEKNLKALGPILTSKLYYPHFEFVLPDEAEEAMESVNKDKEKFDASEHHSPSQGSEIDSYQEASSMSKDEDSNDSDADEAEDSDTFSSQ